MTYIIKEVNNLVNKHHNGTKLILNLTEKEMNFIDDLVKKGEFLNRTDCVRGVIRLYKHEYEKTKKAS